MGLRDAPSGQVSCPRCRPRTTVDRRAFLRGSGLTIGGLNRDQLPLGGTVTPSHVLQTAANQAVCRNCQISLHPLLSGLYRRCRSAETASGSGQEPGWDSPFNLGAHCAKGAARSASTPMANAV